MILGRKNDPGGQDYFHFRGLAWHRVSDRQRAAVRWCERRYRSQDGRAEPEATRHDLQRRGEVEAAGGKALALAYDIRDEQQVMAAARKTAETFGGIDILINNASAINLTPTEATPMKRFDLMFGVNVAARFCPRRRACRT